jgi:hypothetical protein
MAKTKTHPLYREIKLAVSMAIQDFQGDPCTVPEILDCKYLIKKLNELPVDECIQILEKLSRNYLVQFVEYALHQMDALTDERWNALMQSKTLEKIYG